MTVNSRMRVVFFVVAACCTMTAAAASAQTRATVSIRGRSQVLHIYGVRGGTPVIVSSGDGGWIHLGPHVAEVLAASGRFVIGFDVKAYLESFTVSRPLRAEDVAGDYQALVDFVQSAGMSSPGAPRGTNAKPILVGVSEGAGLSLLAAVDPILKSRIGGVIGLGLPDRNELAWRWTDNIIYLTHRVPREPTFSTAAIVDRLAPVPLAAIHSTHDEYVPVAQVHQILDRASGPKRLWTIEAANHRFSDKLAEFDRRLFEAIDWVTVHRTAE